MSVAEGKLKLMRKSGLLYLPDEEPLVKKGRSMVGYSRRGFLGMLAAAIAAPAIAKPSYWSGADHAAFSESITVTLAMHPIVDVGDSIWINGVKWKITSCSLGGDFVPVVNASRRLLNGN